MYDEHLEERLRLVLEKKKVEYETKRMMGGLCFLVDEKMCFGIVKNNLMARIGPEIYEESLAKEGITEMNFTGRAMKGYVYVEPEAMDIENDLEFWVQKCLDFNPSAKSSKKKKKQ